MEALFSMITPACVKLTQNQPVQGQMTLSQGSPNTIRKHMDVYIYIYISIYTYIHTFILIYTVYICIMMHKNSNIRVIR